MNLREAEAIVALYTEVRTALELLDSEDSIRHDWRIQFAAERVIERIFQAVQALDPTRRETYFGDDGLRYLRGMRNRLAHNYLNVDAEILWNTINEDLPTVHDRMLADARKATGLLQVEMQKDDDNADTWLGLHLGRIDPQHGGTTR